MYQKNWYKILDSGVLDISFWVIPNYLSTPSITVNWNTGIGVDIRIGAALLTIGWMSSRTD